MSPSPRQPDQLPLVSVVIATNKDTDLVRKAVQSVFDQDLDKTQYELLLVDNSTGSSIARLARELGTVAPCSFQLHRTFPERNGHFWSLRGPGSARNLGLRHARGQFVAFMDGDCVAARGWLRAGLAAFREGVGIVQGRTLPNPAQRVGVFKHWLEVQEESFLYQTANIFYRRESIDQAGPFMDMGGEDVDLAWRVKRRGWLTGFAENALVHHDVLPLKALNWVCIKWLVVFPYLVREHPELRRFFFLGYFYDRAQAWLTLGLLGVALSGLIPASLLLGLPYLAFRASEPTQTLRGLRRLIRPLAYLPRDLSSFAILLAGSARWRSILL